MDLDPGTPPDPPAPAAPGPAAGRRRRRAGAVLAGVVLLTLAAGGLWAVRNWRRPTPAPAAEAPPAPPPVDPRLAYAGPFLNIHPDVAYVGDEKCAECHEDKAISYRQHPMGHSLLPISRVAARQRYDAEAHNPFEALGTLFLVERRGERVVHRQVGRDDKGQAVYDADTPVDYVLGSGTRGYSYLTDRDGYVFQSPVSWYSQKQTWDTSPGFSADARPGRPVVGMCLFCHANRARPLDGTINRYEEPLFDGTSIGCERCHGPGGRHVNDPGRRDPATGADLSIVNPHHLAPELRAAVCEQCHLAGEARIVHRGRSLYDFRPGLPLEAFMSIYVYATEPGGERKAVNHVEQMVLSRCFRRSEDKPVEGKRKLGCTSCHDPHQHVGPEQRVAHYRSSCLECHRQRGCSVPEATRRLTGKDDSCIDCHMPRYPAADIAHTAATDHRILRRTDRDASPHPQPLSSGTEKGDSKNPLPLEDKEDGKSPPPPGEGKREAGIISFYGQRLKPGDAEAGRDLGIALVHVMVQGMAQRKAPPAGTGEHAVELLEAALRNDPGDLPAEEARAEALALLNRPAAALAAYEAILTRAPHQETCLTGAAMLAQNQQQRELALSYWRRAVAEDPWQSYYRASLARMLSEQKAWDEARPHCEAWVRLDPANVEARVLLVTCLARAGDKATARAEFAKVERLRPPNLPLLQARFTVELRSR